jgi:DNA-binding NtrC family response regulator
MMTPESNVCATVSAKPDRIARVGQMVAAAPAARIWARQQLQVDDGPSAHPGVLAGIASLSTQLPSLREHRRKAEFAPAATADNGPGSEHEGTDRARERPIHAIVSIAEVEKRAILDTLHQLNGDKLLAAQLLGIGRTTIYRKLKEYGLNKAAKSNDN